MRSNMRLRLEMIIFLGTRSGARQPPQPGGGACPWACLPWGAAASPDQAPIGEKAKGATAARVVLTGAGGRSKPGRRERGPPPRPKALRPAGRVATLRRTTALRARPRARGWGGAACGARGGGQDPSGPGGPAAHGGTKAQAPPAAGKRRPQPNPRFPRPGLHAVGPLFGVWRGGALCLGGPCRRVQAGGWRCVGGAPPGWETRLSWRRPVSRAPPGATGVCWGRVVSRKGVIGSPRHLSVDKPKGCWFPVCDRLKTGVDRGRGWVGGNRTTQEPHQPGAFSALHRLLGDLERAAWGSGA